MPTKIQLRRGTAAQWANTNTLLAEGEQGLETDTGKTKIGNGATPWTELPYAGASIGGTDTQVQFNDGGVFGGASGWTWNKATSTMTLASQMNGAVNSNLFGIPCVNIQGSLYGNEVVGIGQRFLFNAANPTVGISLSSDYPLSWSANTGTSNYADLNNFDLQIRRDAANTLAQRNGTNAQTSRIYGSFTDAGNHRRLSLGMSTAGVARIAPEGAGTGASGNVLEISEVSNIKLAIFDGTAITDAGGSFHVRVDNFAVVDGGLSRFSWRFPSYVGALRGFVTANGGVYGWSSTTTENSTPDTALGRAGAGVVEIRNGLSAGTGGALQFNEQTAPAAPATNGVRIYAEDNGSGKTRLMALFATGAAVQIAIEP